MAMTKEQEHILEFLEYSYSGSKMMHDYDTMARLDRAMLAFKYDASEDDLEDGFPSWDKMLEQDIQRMMQGIPEGYLNEGDKDK